jgi:hypothetical protein
LGVAQIEAPTIETNVTVDDMVSDWQVVPFIDVVAGSNDGTCADGYEPMFTNLWQGTWKGALIQNTDTSE